MSEWKVEQKICSECGGVIRLYTTTGHVEGVPKDVQAINVFDLFPASRLCTGHHEPQVNHDGTLDEDGARVFYDALQYVFIQGAHANTDDMQYSIALSPQQALSLLAWLQQEEVTLRSLASEKRQDRWRDTKRTPPRF